MLDPTQRYGERLLIRLHGGEIVDPTTAEVFVIQDETAELRTLLESTMQRNADKVREENAAFIRRLTAGLRDV